MRNLFCLTLLGLLGLAFGKPELPSDQQALVDELRAKLEGNSDSYLQDWLSRTSDGILWNWIDNSANDVGKAEREVVKHAKWRSANNLDNAKDWDYSSEEDLSLPWAITGYDDDGLPVLYMPFGKWDVRNLLAQGKMSTSKIGKQFTRMWEWVMQTPDPKSGETPDNMLFLVDFEDFALRQVTSIRSMAVAVGAATTYMTRFPLYALRTILFRDPPYFQVMWQAVKVVIRGKALTRFTLHGTDEASWRKAIEEIVPPEAIPNTIGGPAKINYITHSVD